MEPRIVIAASALAVAGVVLAALSATALGSAKAAAKWPSAEQPALGVTTARIGLAAGVLLCGAAAGLAGSMAELAESPVAHAGIVSGAVVVAGALSALGAIKLASKIELSSLINSPSPGGGQQAAAMPIPQREPAAGEAEIAYGQPYPGMVQPGMVPAGPPSPVSPAVSSSSVADALHTTTPQTAAPATRSASDSAPEANVPHVQSVVADPADTVIPEGALPGWVYTDAAEDWYLVISIADGQRLLRLTDFTLVEPGTARSPLRLAGSVEMTVWPAEHPDDTGERPTVAEDSPAGT